MTGYLQRLVARTTTAQPARPFAHSRSPIAGRDQRIGLPGFTPSIGAWVEHGPAPDVDPDAGGTAPAPATAFPGPAVDPTGRAVSGDWPGGSTTATVPDPASRTRPPRVANTSDLAGERARGRVATSVRRVGEAVVRAAPPASQPAEPAAPRRPKIATRSPAEGAEGSTATRAEATPRIPGPAIRRGSVSPSAWGGPPDADALVAPGQPVGHERRPRVEIGSIEVEVVTPPAERAPSAPAGPVTAESVSRIGPLAARRPSNLRFAMRVR